MALDNTAILADFVHTGTQAAGTLWQPSASLGEGELESDEVAEILGVEIIAPIDAGVAEDLDTVYLVIDGRSYQAHVNMSGNDLISTNPPRRHIYASDMETTWYTFGKTILESLNEPIPALANTTPKLTDRVTIITQAGGTDVDADYRVRIWGVVYTEKLLQRFPSRTMPGNFTISNNRMDDNIPVNRSPIEITKENWSYLPGGLNQDKPTIHPHFRFATNANATTANTRYEFRFDLGNVDDEFKDMQFNYDTENKLFIAKGLGARASANLNYVWFRDTGDETSTEIPPGRFTVTANRNPIIFGRGEPQFPADQPVYFAIPRIGVKNHVVYESKAVAAIMDNGTPVGADNVAVALTGTVIDFGGKT